MLTETPRLSSPLVANFEGLLFLADQTTPPVTPTAIDPMIFVFENRTAMFNLAFEAWGQVFDPSVAVKLLAPDSSLGPEQFSYLKFVRRFGVILGSAYRAFDATHFTPDLLHQYIKALGKVSDVRDKPNLEEYRGLALESLGTLVQSAQPSTFEPATNNSFAEYVNGVLGGVQAKSQSPGLLIREFHQLRKDLRGMMNLLRISLVMDFDQVRLETFKYLLDLNRQLGENHDELVAKSYSGEINYDIDPTCISHELVYRINNAILTFDPLRLQTN